MSVPEWADEQFSKELPVHRARGEGQHLEYMQSFPLQARELAKELAAFATSNQGIILIGVSDSGDLVGLQDVKTPDGRDSYVKRIEGICRGTVKPAITPQVLFAVEGDEVVLVILTPKGSQPVYYTETRPCVRHLSESRPAEPHEVIDLVRGWLLTNASSAEEDDGTSEMRTELLRLLIDVIIYGQEIESRDVNPWLDLALNQFRYASATLRQIAALPFAVDNALTAELEALADKLDEVLAVPIVMGYWETFEPLVKEAVATAKRVKYKVFDAHGLTPDHLGAVRESLKSQARKLQSLDGRATKLIQQGRLEDVQAEASEIGTALLHVGYLPLDQLGLGVGEAVREVGHDLHLVETAQVFLDGGASVQAIIDRIKADREKLDRAISSMQ